MSAALELAVERFALELLDCKIAIDLPRAIFEVHVDNMVWSEGFDVSRIMRHTRSAQAMGDCLKDAINRILEDLR